MFIYHNTNTGQIIEREVLSPRLESLPHWLLIEASDDGDGPNEGHHARPPVSANKAAWVEYAVQNGVKETDAKSLSKAALIEEFGGDTSAED